MAWLFFVGIFLVYACDNGAQHTTDSNTRTGAIGFQVQWHPSQTKLHTRALSGTCAELGVATVDIEIFDQNNTRLGGTTGPIDCDLHQAIVEKVPEGLNRVLYFLGRDPDGQIIYRGIQTGIEVKANETTDAGDIDAYPFSPASGAPDNTTIADTTNVRFTWHAVDSAKSYRIQVSSNEDFSEPSIDEIVTTPSYSQTLSNGTYFWRVQSIDSLGHESARLECSFTFNYQGPHTIGTTVEGNGSIDPPGPVQVDHNGSQTFTITADPGNFLSALYIDNTSVPLSAAHTFENVISDHTIRAVFMQVWYVDGTMTSSGNGQTWGTAFDNIQSAINTASNGDHIWVKATDYVLTSNITINKPVEIYGGFDGTESFLDQRNWEQNNTVIDGNNAIRCVNISDDATLDGFIIQNGIVEGFLISAAYAGGLYIYQASPIVENCTFLNNRTIAYDISAVNGGAIFNDGGSPTILNCIFTENYSTSGEADAEGGAIFNDGGGGLIRGCTFYGNSVEASEGASGGAIQSKDSTIAIQRCVFKENQCRSNGYNGYGGAVYASGGSPTIEDSTFLSNSVTGYVPFLARGGAVYTFRTTSSTIINCIFAHNTAELLGSVSGYRGMGGAISNWGGDIIIDSCTIMDNNVVASEDATQTAGGGVYNGGYSSYPANAVITNTLLWGNDAYTDAQIYTDSSYATTTLSYCNIDQSGYAGTNGNLRASPSVDAYYHLKSGSVCIDIGSTAVAADMDGEDRPVGDAPDIGADEYRDTLGEGIPDYWDLKFDFDPQNDNTGLDPDDDGLTNLDEYLIGSDPTVSDTFTNAVNRGYWDSSGAHDQAVDQTLVNYASHSYLVFDVSHMAGHTGQSAALRLEIAGYQSSQIAETISLYDVDTPAGEVEASGTGRSDIYNDLGEGDTYAAVSVSSADVGTIVAIPLNDAAVADLNSAVAGDGLFVVGFRIGAASPVTTRQVQFSTGSEQRTHQLLVYPE